MHGLLSLSTLSHGLLPVDFGMLADFGPLALWGHVWPYLVMLLGFSIIVFVHELGHFVVAKWAGVRVEKFAVGFGRELFGFTRGETRYCFNMLPLGGYVKMLGQEDFDDKANELRFNDDPRSFVNKPVGHRMAIASAGVIMNTLFACFLFMIVFLVGKVGLAPRIALVEEDSPAEQAGLLPGDQILRINDRRIDTFEEVHMAVMLAPPHEPIEFLVKRGGDERVSVNVTPESRRPEDPRDSRRLMVGIGNGFTREILGVTGQADASKPQTPRAGDTLVEVDGVEVTDDNVTRLWEMFAYGRGDIIVERRDADHPDAAPERVKVDVPTLISFYPSDGRDRKTMSLLGLTPLVRFDAVDPNGRAGLAGIETGDTILSWDDVERPNYHDVFWSVRDSAGKDLAYTVRKQDGTVRKGWVRPKPNKRGSATIAARIAAAGIGAGEIGATGISATGIGATGVATASSDQPGARVDEVRRFGPAYRSGLRRGDVIVSCNGVENPTATATRRMIRGGIGQALSLQVRGASGEVRAIHVVPVAPGSIDATHRLIAEDLLEIGKIVPEINGKPSPAARSGIAPGVRITQADGAPVQSWKALIEVFRRGAGGAVELGFRSPDGETGTVSFPVPHCLRSVLGLGPEARIIAIDGRKFVDINGKQVYVGYHVGTRAILSELVGRKQVPVKFRRTPIAPIDTGFVDVTAEMVDPWLARVTFYPNIALAQALTLVKGDGALDAVMIGFRQTYYMMRSVYEMLNRMIVSRSVGVDSMAGPLGIVAIGGKFARAGVIDILFFMAIISANLAVINFLPLPIVDGGMMVFLIIEKIKGRPVSLKVQVATQMIGLVMIVSAFLYITYQDAVRLWG